MDGNLLCALWAPPSPTGSRPSSLLCDHPHIPTRNERVWNITRGQCGGGRICRGNFLGCCESPSKPPLGNAVGEDCFSLTRAPVSKALRYVPCGWRPGAWDCSQDLTLAWEREKLTNSFGEELGWGCAPGCPEQGLRRGGFYRRESLCGRLGSYPAGLLRGQNDQQKEARGLWGQCHKHPSRIEMVQPNLRVITSWVLLSYQLYLQTRT